MEIYPSGWRGQFRKLLGSKIRGGSNPSISAKINMTTDISTKRIYYNDTYLDKLEVKVLETNKDENGNYFTSDKTIFHPQGGGQPADEGHLEVNDRQYAITKLVAPRNPHEEPYIIKHYYEGEINFLKGEKVIQVINMEKRLLYSRLHSAGHLIEDAVRQTFPSLKGIRGNHFPNSQAVCCFYWHR
jgi:Ser-tRNA(Ala) deacylase AlaX